MRPKQEKIRRFLNLREITQQKHLFIWNIIPKNMIIDMYYYSKFILRFMYQTYDLHHPPTKHRKRYPSPKAKNEMSSFYFDYLHPLKLHSNIFPPHSTLSWDKVRQLTTTLYDRQKIDILIVFTTQKKFRQFLQVVSQR